MHVVPIAERLPKGGMDDGEKADALAALDGLKADIEAGHIDGVAWAAVGGDYIYQSYVGAGNEFYRLLGALAALQNYLTYIYHTAELADD